MFPFFARGTRSTIFPYMLTPLLLDALSPYFLEMLLSNYLPIVATVVVVVYDYQTLLLAV